MQYELFMFISFCYLRQTVRLTRWTNVKTKLMI